MSRILDAGDVAVIVVDFQEKFAPAVDGFDEAARRAAILAATAVELGMPLVVTEQYPKGLGPTVEAVASRAGGTPALEKTAFAASRAEGFDLAGRKTAVVCGVEAHVCVAQTVLDLLDSGLDVHVAADATASRNTADRAVALDRMRDAGAVITGTEAVVFELLGDASHPSFRSLQELIK